MYVLLLKSSLRVEQPGEVVYQREQKHWGQKGELPVSGVNVACAGCRDRLEQLERKRERERKLREQQKEQREQKERERRAEERRKEREARREGGGGARRWGRGAGPSGEVGRGAGRGDPAAPGVWAVWPRQLCLGSTHWGVRPRLERWVLAPAF